MDEVLGGTSIGGVAEAHYAVAGLGLFPVLAIRGKASLWSALLRVMPYLHVIEAAVWRVMTHRMTTQAGRAVYALRKQTVEPVFGIIKHVMGFRRFSLRGFDKVVGEWTLATLAWNVKRMNILRMA